MLKKIISTLLTLILSFTLATNVFAIEKQTDNISYDDLWRQEVRNYETNVGNLIDEVSGTKNKYLPLALSNEVDKRQEFVNYVISIYNTLSTEQQLEINDYLLGFAEGTNNYNIVNFVNQHKAIKIEPYATYSYMAAVRYAYEHYATNNYNPDYPDITSLGGDCANFVSQCIYAGGKQMDSKWYIKKINDDYPKPTTSSELDHSWDLANPSPWISAKAFGSYWSNNAESNVTYSIDDYLSLSRRIFSGYGVGDVVQITKRDIINYYGYHTMLITQVDGSDYLYTAHTSDRKDANLTNALEGYNTNNYKVKFYAMY